MTYRIPGRLELSDLTPVQAAREQLLRFITRTLSVVGFLAVLLAFLFSRQRVAGLAFFLFFGLATVLLFALTYFPRVPYRLRAATLLLGFYGAGLVELLRAGPLGDGRMWLVAFSLMTIILLGGRWGVTAGVFSVGTLLAVLWLANQGDVPFNPLEVRPYIDGDGFQFVTLTFAMASMVVLVALVRVLDSAGLTIAEEMRLAEELERERQLVEQRVRLRSRALETSAAIGRDLVTILDPDQLVQTVVERIRQDRDLYHVHIFLVTDDDRTLRSAAATGDAGRRLVESGFTLDLEQGGVVARAALSRATVLAPDVVLEGDWLAHPLLPNTRAEAATPIIAGQRLLGVIDVQHDVTGGLGEDDVVLLEVVAAQLSVALQNARFFSSARRRATLEAEAGRTGRAVGLTTSVAEALQVASRSVGDMLAASRTTVVVAQRTGPADVEEQAHA